MRRRRSNIGRSRLLAVLAAVVLPALLLGVSCSSAPPHDLADSCKIFEEKDDWYEAAHASYEKWGVPVNVQLAIIYQESRFVHDAKPPRRKLLWVIPWTRLSSAYGYGQIKDSTWDWYLKSTGRRWADRDDFDDVTDFIGWYGNMSHRMLGISRADAYSQYLAYHEGQGGYKRRTFDNKPWLLRVARQVDDRAGRYRTQLAQCADELDSGWRLWPF